MGDLLGLVKGALVNFGVRHVKKMLPAWSLPGSINMNAALAAGRRHGAEPVKLGHADLAFLQYTGGTTGVSKGAMLTHGNIASNVMQAHAWIKPAVEDGKEFIVTPLPLYHIFALTMVVTDTTSDTTYEDTGASDSCSSDTSDSSSDSSSDDVGCGGDTVGGDNDGSSDACSSDSSSDSSDSCSSSSGDSCDSPETRNHKGRRGKSPVSRAAFLVVALLLPLRRMAKKRENG